MWAQISAIFWAQLRTIRNRLPSSGWGSIVVGFLGLCWYAMYGVLGLVLAVEIPKGSEEQLHRSLPVGLLGVFLFWQVIPLLTLSSGWSLHLNKIQVYPVSNGALFAIEVLLRLSSAPEMILVLLGAVVGLLRHPASLGLAPIFLLSFIPLNLFLSLTIRELLLHSFERNRFRELFAIVLISIGVIPQFLLRTGAGSTLSLYLIRIAHYRLTPWQAVANASLNAFVPADVVLCGVWLVITFFVARRFFLRSLRFEETTRGGNANLARRSRPAERTFPALTNFPGLLLRDPLAALVQKELQSLIRMPRFRVVFGMACIFSIVIFIPLALDSSYASGSEFVKTNFLAIVMLYGLILLSDTLLLNAFGLDRGAAQFYFVAPVSFAAVVRAKNIVAGVFISLQVVTVVFLVILARVHVTWASALNSIASVVVVGVFFLAGGNLSSILMARPADPRQTFRKQAGAKMQFWMLLCSLCMFALLGLAAFAGWALDSDWAPVGVLIVEFGVGCCIYWVTLQTTVQRSFDSREKMIDALSKTSAPL